jgi:hypothetical protein
MVGTDFGVWVVRAIGRPAMIPHALFGIGQITLAQDFSAYIAGIEDEITTIRRTTLRLFGMVVTSSVPSMSICC